MKIYALLVQHYLALIYKTITIQYYPVERSRVILSCRAYIIKNFIQPLA